MNQMPIRCFNVDDCERFARLSGDYNPIHLDPILARRLIFGAPVVHGINTLLWVLDRFGATFGHLDVSGGFDAKFETPVRIGETLRLAFEPRNAGGHTVIAYNGSRRALKLTLPPGLGSPPPQLTLISLPEREHPLELDDTAMVTAAGHLPAGMDLELFADEYPWLCANGHFALGSFLLASTRIVGMKCPGLNSLFSAIKLHRVNAAEPFAKDIDYRASTWRPEFRFAEIEISAGCYNAKLTALMRPAPVSQASMVVVKALVKSGEFSNWNALVIGGSRGLGELTAKLIVAGGGRASITYASGSSDASRLIDEIESAGHRGAASSFHFDVLAPQFPIELKSPDAFTHLFYFATPRILPESENEGDQTLAVYMAFYVDGLKKTLSAFENNLSYGAEVFYPSTVFIEHPEARFARYTGAKMAGENTCRSIASDSHGARKCRIARLPRLATDQVASALPTDIAAAPEEELLRWLRGDT